MNKSSISCSDLMPSYNYSRQSSGFFRHGKSELFNKDVVILLCCWLELLNNFWPEIISCVHFLSNSNYNLGSFLQSKNISKADKVTQIYLKYLPCLAFPPNIFAISSMSGFCSAIPCFTNNFTFQLDRSLSL